jgi:hypothetical protein
MLTIPPGGMPEPGDLIRITNLTGPAGGPYSFELLCVYLDFEHGSIYDTGWGWIHVFHDATLRPYFTRLFDFKFEIINRARP